MKTILSNLSSLLLVAFLLLVSFDVTAQQIENVRFVERGDTLSVHFDLMGETNKWYDIEVQVVENINGKIRFLLPSEGTLSGDFLGIAAGSGQLIQWHFGADPQIENTDNVFLNLLPKEGKFVPKPKPVIEEVAAESEEKGESAIEETQETIQTAKTLTEKEKKQKAKLIEKKANQLAKANRKKQKDLAKAAKKKTKFQEVEVLAEIEETPEAAKSIEGQTTIEKTEGTPIVDIKDVGDTLILAAEKFIKVRKAPKQLFAPKAIPKDSKVWNTIYTASMTEQEEPFSLDQLLQEKNAQKRPQIILKKKPENPFLMDARIALGLMPQDGELPQGIAPSMPPIFIGDLAKTETNIGLAGQLKTSVAPPTPLKGKAKRAIKQKEKAQIAAAKRQTKVDKIAAKKQAKIDKKRARKEKERPFWDLFKKVKKDDVSETEKAAYSKYSRWREKQ